MIVALNNKCNLTKQEFEKYLDELKIIDTNHLVILCPSHINIGQINIDNVKVGSENVSKTNKGAYTGEISSEQLKSYGVEYCIVGHSERREYQKETNNDIKEKILRLLEQDITPILCIGESKEERENNQFKDVIKEELEIATSELTETQKEKLIVAYEPIWSIGTGIIPTNDQIIDVFEYIKKFLPTSKILYGGSANLSNINTLKAISQIDGYLLGGISLKVNDLSGFIKIL